MSVRPMSLLMYEFGDYLLRREGHYIVKDIHLRVNKHYIGVYFEVESLNGGLKNIMGTVRCNTHLTLLADQKKLLQKLGTSDGPTTRSHHPTIAAATTIYSV